jgi:hypothetical protein
MNAVPLMNVLAETTVVVKVHASILHLPFILLYVPSQIKLLIPKTHTYEKIN